MDFDFPPRTKGETPLHFDPILVPFTVALQHTTHSTNATITVHMFFYLTKFVHMLFSSFHGSFCWAPVGTFLFANPPNIHGVRNIRFHRSGITALERARPSLRDEVFGER